MEFEGKFDLEFDIDLGGEEDGSDPFSSLFGPGKLKWEMTGRHDAHDPEQIKFEINGEGEAQLGAGGFELLVTGGLDAIGIGEDIYLKVDLPDMLAAFGFGAFENKWIHLDVSELEEETGVASDYQDIALINEKVAEILGRHDIIESVENKGTETISGVNTTHYEIEYNETGFKSAVLDIVKEINEANPAMSELDQDELAEIEDIQEKFVNSMTLGQTDIWIDKVRVLPMRLKARLGVNIKYKDLYDDVTLEYMDLPEDAGVSYTIYYDITYTSFNEEINIVAPEGAVGLDELLGSAFDDSMMFGGDDDFMMTPPPSSSASEKNRDAKRISTVRQVQLGLALYQDANGSYPLHVGESSAQRWANLERSLTPVYIAAFPFEPDSTSFDYVSRDGNTYVVRTFLEDKGHSALSNDEDGVILGLQCADSAGAYCVTN